MSGSLLEVVSEILIADDVCAAPDKSSRGGLRFVEVSSSVVEMPFDEVVVHLFHDGEKAGIGSVQGYFGPPGAGSGHAKFPEGSICEVLSGEAVVKVRVVEVDFL